MRFRFAILSALAAALAASASAQPAGPGPSAAAAEKMAAACVAYAKAHDGAVNIWVYDAQGGMVHFQRMDGAPRLGPGVSGLAGEDFDPGAPGAVPVLLNGQTVGTVRAAGMGAINDRACARAAADAAPTTSR